jgi:hypothetical protein
MHASVPGSASQRCAARPSPVGRGVGASSRGRSGVGVASGGGLQLAPQRRLALGKRVLGSLRGGEKDAGVLGGQALGQPVRAGPNCGLAGGRAQPLKRGPLQACLVCAAASRAAGVGETWV